jgi:hypothetical protein
MALWWVYRSIRVSTRDINGLMTAGRKVERVRSVLHTIISDVTGKGKEQRRSRLSSKDFGYFHLPVT